MNELINQVEQWSKDKGLDQAESSKQFLKVTEEVGEVASALAASGYITWKGSGDFQQAMENLNLISNRGQELKSERDAKYRENEQLVNQIKDKENIIKDKDNQIDAKAQELESLRKENDNLKQSSTKNSNELKQAEKDMSDVNKETKKVLDGLK